MLGGRVRVGVERIWVWGAGALQPADFFESDFILKISLMFGHCA